MDKQTETTVELKKAVCVILRKGNLILSVSRKDNHEDKGLVGGKVDDTDDSVELACIREAKEETGYDICSLKLIDSRVWGGYLQHCFVADYRGRIDYNREIETGLVEWVTPQRLVEGSFGAYNLEIFRQLNLI